MVHNLNEQRLRHASFFKKEEVIISFLKTTKVTWLQYLWNKVPLATFVLAV
jgi:hypothetical protein